MELLLVTDPSNMAWLTGYDGWSFYTHQCAVVAGDGFPLWYGREMDAACARKTCYIGEENIVGYPDFYVQNPLQHPMEHLADWLKSRGVGGQKIGVEMDNYYFSAAAFAALQAGLPSAKWVDATGLVNWQRAVKSAAEVDYMQRAARIVEAMHRRVYDTIKPGLRKNELVAEIYHAGIIGTVGGNTGDNGNGTGDVGGNDGNTGNNGNNTGDGGDYPAIVPLVPTGGDAGAPHLTWDDRPIPPNSGTFMEIAGVYKRYHCPTSRTIYLGKPPAKFRRAEAALQEGIAAGMAAAKPGNQCRDIADALFTTLQKHGFQKDNRCGYSIGLSYPPDWGERTMSFRTTDQTELSEGMTFHFMPGLWLEDWGIEITESLLITEAGCESLANIPRELLVKDI